MAEDPLIFPIVIHTMEEATARASSIISMGHALVMLTVPQELSIREVAWLLNVSGQYVQKIVDRGDLTPLDHPSGWPRPPNTPPRIRFKLDDVLELRRKRHEAAQAALDEMIKDTQEAGGYPELDDADE